MRRRGRASQVIDLIDLELEGINHIMTHQFEAGMANKVLDICLTSCEKIIKANDLVSLLDEAVAKV
jgi:hypothetical protein